jgi:rubredoxin
MREGDARASKDERGVRYNTRFQHTLGCATFLFRESKQRTRMTVSPNDAMGFKTWMCLVCGMVYDEAEGWPDDGIAAGTRWDDVPLGWCCPECGARKEDFEMVEL